MRLRTGDLADLGDSNSNTREIMISVCVCTHSPRGEVIGECLERLRALVVPDEGLELLLIDNASAPALSTGGLGLDDFPYPCRLVREDRLGLSHARARAAREAGGAVIVFVDDDNFLERDYAARVSRRFAESPGAGVVGGVSRPRFQAAPPEWVELVWESLALRDLGPAARRLTGKDGVSLAGAGLAVRTSALRQALATPLLLEDRKGARLSSGGDTELIVRMATLGWESWYDGALRLEHLIPPGRLQLDYLSRLQFGFGVASCSIELYGGFRRDWGFLWYLRRAWFHRRAAWSEARTARSVGGANERVAALLRRSYHSGRARGFAGLAFDGRWRGVVGRVLERCPGPGGVPEGADAGETRG